MHEEILIYGLRHDGQKNVLIHIDDAENGRDCNCECPHCHAPLVARNGGKGGRYRQNIHHFAHDRGYDPCGKGQMSALHIMAQYIIEEEKRVLLPEYSKEYVKHSSKLQSFDNITLEEECKDEVSRRRPDCIGRPYMDNNSLWIEIYCTNPITLERRDDIIRREQYCIEIDFSDLLETEYTKEIVRDRLLTSSKDRKWICHPEWDEEERKKEEEAKIKQEEEKKLQEEERRQAMLQWEERRLQLDELLRERAEKQRRQEEILRQLKEERHKEAEKNTKEISPSEHTVDFYPKEIKDSKTPQTKTDWVMYAKNIYGNNDALDSFYNLLSVEYSKVVLENSHPIVVNEVYLRCNELLPRTDMIAEVNKTYLLLLLSIWVLSQLNHSESSALGKLFVDDKNLRNNLFRFIKQIRNINKRQIEDTFVPVGTENRDKILQILQICYKS